MRLFLALSFLLLSVSAQAQYMMYQRWSHLLMSHWSLSPQDIRPLVPEDLEIDTFDGRAFVTAVALEMTDGKILNMGDRISRQSLYSPFAQLNVRTYVKYKGKKGIYFFKIFADHHIAPIMAQLSFGLPYVYGDFDYSVAGGRMDFTANFNDQLLYSVQGEHSGRSQQYEPGTLQNFLTDRPMSFQVKRSFLQMCVYSAELFHERWTLTDAKVSIAHNSIPEITGLPHMERSGPDFYVPGIDVYFLPSQKLGCR